MLINQNSGDQFISALVKNLQAVCHGNVEFDKNVKVVGHLFLTVDSSTEFNYIVNEKVSKSDESSTTFISKSFYATDPQQKTPMKSSEGPLMSSSPNKLRKTSASNECNSFASGINSRPISPLSAVSSPPNSISVQRTNPRRRSLDYSKFKPQEITKRSCLSPSHRQTSESLSFIGSLSSENIPMRTDSILSVSATPAHSLPGADKPEETSIDSQDKSEKPADIKFEVIKVENGSVVASNKDTGTTEGDDGLLRIESVTSHDLSVNSPVKACKPSRDFSNASKPSYFETELTTQCELMEVDLSRVKEDDKQDNECSTSKQLSSVPPLALSTSSSNFLTKLKSLRSPTLKKDFYGDKNNYYGREIGPSNVESETSDVSSLTLPSMDESDSLVDSDRIFDESDDKLNITYDFEVLHEDYIEKEDFEKQTEVVDDNQEDSDRSDDFGDDDNDEDFVISEADDNDYDDVEEIMNAVLSDDDDNDTGEPELELSDYPNEQHILRSKSNPLIYIHRVMFSERTLTGKQKKNLRVYNSLQYCDLCDKTYSKFSRHIFKKHLDNEEVKTIYAEKDVEKYRRLLHLLRLKFNHKFNMQTIKNNKGEIILSKRPQSDFDILHYGPCPCCFAWVRKNLMDKHYSFCSKFSGNEKHYSLSALKTQSDVIAQRLIQSASQQLIDEVFTIMKNDEVGKLAKNDDLIVMLGNQWLNRYESNSHRNHYTSQVMRLAARMLSFVKLIEPLDSVAQNMTDYLKEEHLSSVIDAAVKTTECVLFNRSKGGKRKGYILIKLKDYIKTMSNIKIAKGLINGDVALQNEGKEVLKSLDEYWIRQTAHIDVDSTTSNFTSEEFQKTQEPPEEENLHANEIMIDKVNQVVERLEGKKKQWCKNSVAKWSKEEEAEINIIFKKFIDNKKRPKPSACDKAIEISRINNGFICKRSRDTLKKKIFRIIDKLTKQDLA